MNKLRITNLFMKYENKYILRDFALSLREGELLVILGESGCGKSTLLKIIAGIITPEKGQILLENQEVSHISAQFRKVGYVPQAQVLFPHLTVQENIAFGLSVRNLSPASRHKRILEVVHLTEIEDLLDRYPHEISGGQKQRVALARALVIKPSLLLLDEPLSSIDRSAREQLALIIRNINQKTQTAILYVTHNHEEAQLIADRIAIMENGQVVQDGTYLDVYNYPRDYQVAKIMGKPNIWEVPERVPPSEFPAIIETPIADIPAIQASTIINEKITGLYLPPSEFQIIPNSEENREIQEQESKIEASVEKEEFNKMKGEALSEKFQLDISSTSLTIKGILLSSQILPEGTIQAIISFGGKKGLEYLKIWLPTPASRALTKQNKAIVLTLPLSSVLFL